MVKKVVPNQRIIRIKKSYIGKNDIFSVRLRAAARKARMTLKPNAYKIYDYMSENQDGYEFALSRKVIMEECNITKTTYDAAIKELIDKNFLVQKTNNSNYYIFYENGYEEYNSRDENHTTQILADNTRDEIHTTQMVKNNPLMKDESHTTSTRDEIHTTKDKIPVTRDENHTSRGLEIYYSRDENHTRNNTYNTKEDRSDNPPIIFGEKLKELVISFINREKAFDAAYQLLEQGMTEEWIIAAMTFKKQDDFDRYGFGLLFTEDYQKQINEYLRTKTQREEAKQKCYDEVFKDVKPLFTQPEVIKINYTGGSHRKKNRLKEIDMNTLLDDIEEYK